MSCTFTIEAYIKIVLHAAKYPTLSVCGLLMGRADSHVLEYTEVTDAVPVCHYAPVGPIFDMVADVMSQKATTTTTSTTTGTSTTASTGTVEVIGCYYCNGYAVTISPNKSASATAGTNTADLPPFMEKVCGSIKRRTGCCALAILHNNALIVPAFRLDKLCLSMTRDGKEVTCAPNTTTPTACQHFNTTLLACLNPSTKYGDGRTHGMVELLIDAEDFLAFHHSRSDRWSGGRTDFANSNVNELIWGLKLSPQEVEDVQA